MSNTDFLDWQAPEEHIETPELETFNWLNGKGEAFTALHPVIATGGFEFAHEDWGVVLAGSYTPVQVPKKEGALLAYLFKELHLSVIAAKEIWGKKDENGNDVYFDQYQPGTRSKLSVYCLVKELAEAGWAGPAVLVIKGMAAKAFKTMRRQHGASVLRPATMLGKANHYPSYMFWTVVKAAAQETVGQGSETNSITPPVPAWDTKASATQDTRKITDMVVSLYIGNDFRDIISGVLFEQGQQWLKSKVSDTPTTNGQPAPEPEPPLFDEDEPPF